MTTVDLHDGRTLAYAEYGAPDGDPLLFFHGLPGSRMFASALDGDASAAGLRVIAPDRPGFGGSSFQPGRKFVDWPADVRALVDHLGIDRFLVSGISGGGVYTLAVAHQLGDRVRAAGVISGAGDVSTDEALEGMHENNRGLFQLAKQSGAAAVVEVMTPIMEAMKADPEGAMKSMVDGMPPADLELLERRTDIRDAMQADATEATAQGLEGVAHEVVMFTGTWGFDVSEIRVPVVLWHGDDDRNAPLSHAEKLTAQIPEAELVVWTGMGHLTALDRMPDVFGRLRDVAR